MAEVFLTQILLGCVMTDSYTQTLRSTGKCQEPEQRHQGTLTCFPLGLPQGSEQPIASVRPSR